MSRSVWRRRLVGSMRWGRNLTLATLPAFAATRRQHCSTIGRGNAGSKAMHRGHAVAFFGWYVAWHRGTILEK